MKAIWILSAQTNKTRNSSQFLGDIFYFDGIKLEQSMTTQHWQRLKRWFESNEALQNSLNQIHNKLDALASMTPSDARKLTVQMVFTSVSEHELCRRTPWISKETCNSMFKAFDLPEFSSICAIICDFASHKQVNCSKVIKSRLAFYV